MTLNMSIDPGVNGAGIAYWQGDSLLGAEYVGGIGGQCHPLMEVPANLVAHVGDVTAQAGGIKTLVIEIPVIRDTAHQKGGAKGQKDLIKLAICAGAMMFALRPSTEAMLTVSPEEWKGQLSKPISEKRSRKLLNKDEIAGIEFPSAKSLHHNVWDAIGIGLWRFRA